MPNKWREYKEGQRRQQNNAAARVFFDLLGLPSAGSQTGCFRTSLGCKPRSLMRISLDLLDKSKNVINDESNSDFKSSY
jgi:hypothetical protein